MWRSWRKRIWGILLLWSGVAHAGGHGLPADRPWSLDDVVAWGRAHNPDIMMARQVRAEAAARLEARRGDWYPQVVAEAGWMRADAPSAYLFGTIDERKLPPGTDFNDPGHLDSFEVGITAKMRLFDSGRTPLSIRQGEEEVREMESRICDVENRVVSQVVRLFHEHLAAREEVRIWEASKKTVAEQLRVTAIRFEGGSALRSDLLSLEVREAEISAATVVAENRVAVIAAKLKNALGLPLDAGIRLGKGKGNAGRVTESEEALFDLARTHRPELAASRIRNEIATLQLERKKREHGPAVGVLARYWMKDGDAAFNRDRENWQVGVNVSVPVFEGFTTTARIREAGIRKRRMEAEAERLWQQVALDIRQRFLELQAAGKRLQVAEKAVALASESFSLVSVEFQGGSAGVTRYLEAELDQSRTRRQRVRAELDVAIAEAELMRAVGLWSRKNGEEGEGS